MPTPESMSIYVVISQSGYYPSGDNCDWEFITTDFDTALSFARHDEGYLSDHAWVSIVRISTPDCTHDLVWTSEKDS